VLLAHGACPRGADAIAAACATCTPGYQLEPYQADRHRHGLAAGQLRNAEMIALDVGRCVWLQYPRSVAVNHRTALAASTSSRARPAAKQHNRSWTLPLEAERARGV
jgi:hypothetical protein